MAVSPLVLRSGLLSFLLHLAAAAVLLVSFDFAKPRIIRPQPRVDIVEAVTVDNKQVEQELQRLQQIEQEKQEQQARKERELEQKLRDLQKQADKAEQDRKTEEKRLAELDQRKQEEKRAREEEQKKLAQLKKDQEALDKKKKEEEERKRREETQRKQREESERLARLEQEKKAEEERQRRAAEEEQRRQAQAEQQRADQALLSQITAEIYRRVVNNFNISGLPSGLECVLVVRTIPGGEVVSVDISRSSGNDVYDRRAVLAVQKASPLPLPADAATFERLGLRYFTFPFRL